MSDAPGSSADLSADHVWHFVRAGGFDQVKLESGADLQALGQLDQKLWVALSCPVRGLEFDEKTLQLIDTDQDGRIRVPEVLAAVAWACARLRRPGDLVAGAEALPLDAIRHDTDEGRQLLASARQILTNLGKPDATALSVQDTSNTASIYAQTRFNGDGVVAPEAAEDPALQAVARDLIACLGGEADLSGEPGISQAKVDQFFADLEAYATWRREAEDQAEGILPLGEGTPAAFQALQAVRHKVEDYFTRCRLVAFDARAADVLNRSPEDFAALAAGDLSPGGEALAAFPLARAEAGAPLPLDEGLNPAWRDRVAAFRDAVVAPLLGQDTGALGESEWDEIQARFAPYEAWLARKAGAAVEPLGLERVREILASDARERLAALIAEDKALEPEMKAIAAVDRLVRYHRDLFRLLNNFVSFADFYAADRGAIFQAGTLYLDGRACHLCVRVDDPARHAALAGLSKAYLAYCTCTRKDSPETLTIAAAFTGGDSENLMAGRNGVFYDRKGQDWDATVVKVLENPISVRQAILAPYRRIGRMVGEQIERMAAARDKAVTEQAATTLDATAKTAEGAKPPEAPSFDIAKFAGVFAAIGLALGALGTALASIVAGFLRLAPWQMPLVVLGVLLLISGPSVVIAWLKLRQRNLAPILDGCGWAVNSRVKINIAFGRVLTAVARLPKDARRTLVDPYRRRRRGRWLLVLFLVAVLLGGAATWWFVLRGAKPARPAESGAPAEPAAKDAGSPEAK